MHACSCLHVVHLHTNKLKMMIMYQVVSKGNHIVPTVSSTVPQIGHSFSQPPGSCTSDLRSPQRSLGQKHPAPSSAIGVVRKRKDSYYPEHLPLCTLPVVAGETIFVVNGKDHILTLSPLFLPRGNPDTHALAHIIHMYYSNHAHVHIIT